MFEIQRFAEGGEGNVDGQQQPNQPSSELGDAQDAEELKIQVPKSILTQKLQKPSTKPKKVLKNS